MPNTCKLCQGQISRTANRVKCASCTNLYHTICIGGNDEELNSEWQCAECNDKSKEPSLNDIMKMLHLIREEQKEACNSINNCHSRIDEMNGFKKHLYLHA